MDCTDWTASLGSKEAEKLLKKIGQSLGFELKHAKVGTREDLHVWWYETRWVDGKCLETLEAVCFPDEFGGFGGYAFSKPSRLLHAALQNRIFRVNICKDGRRWQESHFVLNPVFNAKSLEELEIALDLLGERREEKERRAVENEC